MNLSDILFAAIALTVLATAAWGLVNAARIGVLVVERNHWRRQAKWALEQATHCQQRCGGQVEDEMAKWRMGL